VYVAKVGNLKVRWSRRLPAAPTSLTVTKDSCGRYFLSFVVDTEPDILPGLQSDVGIDLGLSAFAVLSDGSTIDSPRFLRRAERKLKRLQRELSRKARGSKNRAKARIKVARQHAKVADRRRDFHHKASTQIIRDNQAVYVEDLAVSGLERTRLAKSVHDAGWSAFVGMLEYKAVKHGRTFAKVDRALKLDLYRQITTNLTNVGVRPEDVFITLTENALDTGSVGNGRAQLVDLGAVAGAHVEP
jgi:putative transposase